MTGPGPKRYAKAIVALAEEAGVLEPMGEELARVAEAFRQGDLAAAAESPTLDTKTKRAVVARVVEGVGGSPLLRTFLSLLTERSRLPWLGAIEREYRKLVDRKLGRVRARIRSPKPLSRDDLQRVTQQFAARLGKSVLAEVEVEDDLLGGIIVEVEGRVYDASIKTQLEGLRAALSG